MEKEDYINWETIDQKEYKAEILTYIEKLNDQQKELVEKILDCIQNAGGVEENVLGILLEEAAGGEYNERRLLLLSEYLNKSAKLDDINSELEFYKKRIQGVEEKNKALRKEVMELKAKKRGLNSRLEKYQEEFSQAEEENKKNSEQKSLLLQIQESIGQLMADTRELKEGVKNFTSAYIPEEKKSEAGSVKTEPEPEEPESENVKNEMEAKETEAGEVKAETEKAKTDKPEAKNMKAEAETGESEAENVEAEIEKKAGKSEAENAKAEAEMEAETDKPEEKETKAEKAETEENEQEDLPEEIKAEDEPETKESEKESSEAEKNRAEMEETKAEIEEIEAQMKEAKFFDDETDETEEDEIEMTTDLEEYETLMGMVSYENVFFPLEEAEEDEYEDQGKNKRGNFLNHFLGKTDSKR